MPDDWGVFRAWVEDEDPSYTLGIAVRAWIERLDQAPWQYPSAPVSDMSVEGEYQVRFATVFGVDVIYGESYPTDGSPAGPVDLIDVRSHR